MDKYDYTGIEKELLYLTILIHFIQEERKNTGSIA